MCRVYRFGRKKKMVGNEKMKSLWLTCGSDGGEIWCLRHSRSDRIGVDGEVTDAIDIFLSFVNFCYTKACSPPRSPHQSGKRSPSWRLLGVPQPSHGNER